MTEEQREIQFLKNEVRGLTSLVEELIEILVSKPTFNGTFYICPCGNQVARLVKDQVIPYIGAEFDCDRCHRRINWKGIKYENSLGSGHESC